MPLNERKVLIVGAGLTGLNCAVHLKKQEIPYEIFERDHAPGGRVQTDRIDGYLLDRGFQVLLSAYPEAQSALDYHRLRLRSFRNGALVRFGDRFHNVADPAVHADALLGTLTAPIGSIGDKINVLRHRRSLASSTLAELSQLPETTTLEALRSRLGFSDKIIDRFYRPFLGGIMLDSELGASSRMFDFVSKMFIDGETCIPESGIGQIPKQLAKKLYPRTMHFGKTVTTVSANSITLDDGSVVEGSHVVVATQQPADLLPARNRITSRPVTCLYFAADKAPDESPTLMLNGNGKGAINNVAVMSNVSPAYAPNGKALISVSVLDQSLSEGDLKLQVQKELAGWFGAGAQSWTHLKTYVIPHAQPDQSPPALSRIEREVEIHGGVVVAGDFITTASINGALKAGRLAAETLRHLL